RPDFVETGGSVHRRRDRRRMVRRPGGEAIVGTARRPEQPVRIYHYRGRALYVGAQPVALLTLMVSLEAAGRSAMTSPLDPRRLWPEPDGMPTRRRTLGLIGAGVVMAGP